MKTNEEMLADLLERKKEYDIKRAATRRRISVLSAALALILIISTVTTAALIAVNKNTPSTPNVMEEFTEIDETEKTEEQTTVNTDEITDDKREEKITPPQVYGISPFYTSFVKYGDLSNLESVYSHMETEGSITYDTGVWISQYEEIKEYEVNVSLRVDQNIEIEGKVLIPSDFNDVKACMILIPSESIELLTDDFIILDFTENESDSFILKFKYKEGYTNGKIEYMIFNESDGNSFYSELDGRVEKSGILNYYENKFDLSYPGGEYKIIQRNNIYFAAIKGYDFRKYKNADINQIYRLAAEYFGDVDESGKPIFENNPYIQEYYDCPYCWNIRYMNERAFQNGENYLRVNSITQGEDETSPNTLFSNLDNSKGGVLHQYNATIYGIIGWTDSNNTTHYARNVTVAVYDTSDPTVALDSTTTSEYGSYFLHFNIPAIEPLNISVKICTAGQGINVKRQSTNTLYENVLLNCNDIPENYYVNSSKVFPYATGCADDILFNKAISVHQSLEVANRYVNSLLSGPDIDDIDVRYYEGITLDSEGNHDGTHYYNNVITIEYYDSFDWDVIEHEYGHFVSDKIGFLGRNAGGDHDQYKDLLAGHSKDHAIKMAWNEGFADFFAINVQRIMIDGNSTPIPNVGDVYYNDTNIPYKENIDGEWFVAHINDFIRIDIENYIDTSDITGYTDVPGFDHTMFKGETNEITVAALLLDLVDGISMTDSDITTLSDSKIWSIIIGDETDTEDGCKTLSDFMNAFHDSTELTANEKFYSMYLLRRYELNPYNISVTNVNTNSPLISWTNVSAQNENRIRILDSSFNQLNIPQITVTNQSSYVVPWPMWTTYAQGHSSLIIVVEGVSSSTPETDRYYSSYYTVVLNAA